MKLQYKGLRLKEPKTIKRENVPPEILFPYIANDDLIRSVNLAILLKRPLLLMGEPGCGKSRLAQAVAYELYHKEKRNGQVVIDYKDFYREWNIKSTSKAKDGLYEYDAIQRLGDAYMNKNGLNLNLDKSNYVSMQAMGEAFQNSKSDEHRTVLLIDEIDKADIDFPNDLLNELDKGEFKIIDTKETVRATVKPIVFITSNAEKELPDAFLRRCLYHYIQPLNKEILTEIIERRFYSDEKTNKVLISKALTQFLGIRNELKRSAQTVGKNISTSELLDWFEAIKYFNNIQKNSSTLKGRNKSHLKSLVKELDKLGKGNLQIPFQEVLFKNWDTVINFNES